MKKDNPLNQHRSKVQTVLAMQAGGSLGAYECGICKSLARHSVKFDIIAGTSIGAVNATILAAGYDQENGISESVKTLEDFWLDMAENITPSYLPYKQRAYMAAAYTLTYGNARSFTPIWFIQGGLPYYYLLSSPYLYSTVQLKETLNKYIDFRKLKSTIKNPLYDATPRLILTSTDIQKAEPVVFDSNNTSITVEQVAACTGYGIYGISWEKIDGRYLWDGSLSYSTPLKAVVNASPKHPKRIYMSDVFPKTQEKLPGNMYESLHRIRDILFTDKSLEETVKSSDIIKKHFKVMERMYCILSTTKLEGSAKSEFEELEEEFKGLIEERGRIIDQVIHIQRKENPDHHFLFEDADFSSATIKQQIKEGEIDGEAALAEKKEP
jgi:NTE family protein